MGTPASDQSYPSVLRMSAPLMVSFMMRAAFTFVDTIYAATVGDAAVGAIGLTVPFEFLMIACWVGLSTGLTSALSRAMGANEGEKIEQYLKGAWVLVCTVSPVFLLIGGAIWFAAPQLGIEPDLYEAFRIYGSVLIAGSAFTAFWSVIPDSIVKAHQDTRSTMWAGISSNLTNVVLNTIFLFVFHWGVFGIALSTVLGRIAGLVYATHRARIHERRRKQEGQTPVAGVDSRPYWTMLSLAVPASITFALMSGEVAVINTLLAGFENSKEAIAAYSIYYRVVLFAANPIIAISVAMLPYAARRIGADDGKGLRAGLRQATWFSSLYALGLVGPIMLLSGPWLASSLAESPLTAEYTTFALRLVPLATLAVAPFLLCRPVFEAMGRGRPGLIMAAIRYLVLTIPAAWGGIRVAENLGYPPLYGMLIALLGVAVVSSSAFALWLKAALPGDVSDIAPVDTEPTLEATPPSS